ncbi:ABC transporter ATP-binding protein [Geomicrobium sp. JSM 1781026]
MADQTNTLLRIENIEKSFGDTTVLKDISIDVAQGELITFIGPSGSGKTTLLRIVGGFHDQSSGEIVISGASMNGVPPEKRETGMVFQNYALFPHMTVYQNVEYGLKIAKVTKEERRTRIEEALQQVHLHEYADRKPSELSGGQQQRVAIARCLVLKPKVLLLDEPLSNLDANLRAYMRDEIRRLKEELNLTIIFVTHDQDEALSISDRVLVLDGGLVQQLDDPSTVYQQPANEFVANFVGYANIIEGTVEAGVFKAIEEEGFQLNVNGLDAKSKLVIRPEHFEVTEDGPIHGRITKTVYHGSYTRCSVQIGQLELLVDARKENIKRDMDIRLSHPTHLHFID